MSESDDWENAADDILDDKPAVEEEKKEEGKFEDEDAVDSDDERKAAAVIAKAKRAAEDLLPKKVKASKKDYEAMFAERHGKGAAKAAALTKDGKTGEMVSMAAEEDIVDAMFAPELNTDSGSLKSEQTYVKFAQQVGDVLYEGQSAYNIPAFFLNLAKGMNSQPLTSLDLKKIVDGITVVYNAKIAEEK